MIVKKIPNPKASSPKASRIGSLLDYIESQTGEKIELRFATGDFLTDSRQGQRAEMIALAGEATRSKDPVDHWLLSWKAGEQPSEGQCRDAVEILKQHLGMSSTHQAVCALHRNTENLHLHIVMNRTDPETFRVSDNGWSIDRAHQALAEIVHQQGWQQEQHAIRGVGLSRNRSDVPIQAPSTRARDFENTTGAKSAQRIGIEEIPNLLHPAMTWDDVHSALAARGMRYEAKGSGALIWIGDTAVKASSVGREFSRKRMEERYGACQPSQHEVPVETPKQASQPLRARTDVQWIEYRASLNMFNASRDEALRELRVLHRKAREEQTSTFSCERKALFEGGRWQTNSLNVARSLLAADQAKRKAALTSKHAEEREAAKKNAGVRPSYEQFLHAAGQDKLADLWRYRNSSLEVASLYGDGSEELSLRDVRDFATRIGRTSDKRNLFVGYYDKTKPDTLSFADRGKQIDIYQSTDRATVLAALQVACQKWGVVTVTGPAEFQLLCVELAREHGFRLQNLPLSPLLLQPEQAISRSVTPTASAYELHRRDILNKVSIKNPSQLDWMIAVRMRATGHAREDIAAALRVHAKEGRTTENRDWSNYAERTVQAVFGPRGDREHATNQSRASAWAQVEGREVGRIQDLPEAPQERLQERRRPSGRGMGD